LLVRGNGSRESERGAAGLLAGRRRNRMASDNELEPAHGACLIGGHDEPGTDRHVRRSGARHGRRGFAGGQAHIRRARRFRIRIAPTIACAARAERLCSQRFGVDRTNAGLDDGQGVVPELGERAAQWVCFGSDQAESPVTTSNFLRSELTS
jgi:hypothetical protein